jgi:uncharacterized protein YpuA (DUF1002 family)
MTDVINNNNDENLGDRMRELRDDVTHSDGAKDAMENVKSTMKKDYNQTKEDIKDGASHTKEKLGMDDKDEEIT